MPELIIESHANSSADEFDIAIIGMAGRFPGARDISAFWRLLKDGVEGISFFTPEGAGGPPASTGAYVGAGGILEEIDLFDAEFFGVPPAEAEWMDPQQRLFLEHAWAALESAGYSVDAYPGRVSIYAGVNLNTYFLSRLEQIFARDRGAAFQIMLGNEKDFLATRVSYKLNLHGESVTVQTSCSSSLVAVHLACQSVLTGQSDMALAGGVSIRCPQKSGYFYDEGMISSPDGHCRAFDRRAQGTVPGNGLGIVVLKRLADALRDGDHVWAVIKSSCVNNDGRQKVGYTAPSVDGQTDVIARALAMAGARADTIGFVEGHGTGTPIGDPIEFQALTRAFRRHTERKGYCALGAVKSNIGHLDTAAGIAGLIKAVLALHHRVIPPTLHFEEPNPALDLDNSPFFINSQAIKWPAGDGPRHAGVSSFGIGGTNAHVILEEAPPAGRSYTSRSAFVITLSARTPEALARMREELALLIEAQPELEIEDVAFTRNIGRRMFPFRYGFVAPDRAAVLESLRTPVSKWCSQVASSKAPRVVFMFPGQGSGLASQFASIYQSEPDFRSVVDRCAEILRPSLGCDLRERLLSLGVSDNQMQRAEFALPALFVFEYGLARLWMTWGIKPSAMIGHSLGEYVAACVSGVFSLEDALTLVAARGRLVQELPPGAMLGIGLSESALGPYLGEDLALAAVNTSDRCVVSGPVEAIEELERTLTQQEIGCLRLPIPYAYHSRAVEPILDRMKSLVKKAQPGIPQIPYISSSTGNYVQPEQTSAPGYWATQMRNPTRFADGLKTLFAAGHSIFIEVGPNQGLTRAVREELGREPTAVDSVGASRTGNAARALHEALVQVWLHGGQVNWQDFYRGQRLRRVVLPSYPFERKRSWIEVQSPMAQATADVAQAARMAPQAPAQQMDIRLVETNRETAINRAGLESKYVEPRNKIEERLASIWSVVLGIGRVGVEDNFMELGGDSLMATRMFAQVQRAFSTGISLEQVLSSPTIAELSRALQAGLQAAVKTTTAERQHQDYCAFEMSIGDEEVTVYLTESDYHIQGVPEGARNFRIVL